VGIKLSGSPRSSNKTDILLINVFEIFVAAAVSTIGKILELCKHGLDLAGGPIYAEDEEETNNVLVFTTAGAYIKSPVEVTLTSPELSNCFICEEDLSEVKVLGLC
jgi:hypothetical protein